VGREDVYSLHRQVTNWTIVKTCLWFTDELVINFGRELTNNSDSGLGR
jgi:hypothetical protein